MEAISTTEAVAGGPEAPLSSSPKAAHTWERANHEWYVEPRRSTEQLLEVERFVGPVLDPCCGGGNIVSACRAAGYRAFGSDIVRRTDEPWFLGEQRFEDIPDRAVANVISNPPFERGQGTERFIRKALTIATGKVAVFCALPFLAGKSRAAGLWLECTPHRVWVITPRPSCPPGRVLEAGGKAAGGTEDWCWLVFDLTAPPAQFPQLGWLKGAQ